MMGPLTPVFATAVFAPLAINLIASRGRREPDVAVSMSLLVLIVWGCTRFLAAHLPVPDRAALTPMLDVIGGLSALGAWAMIRTRWLAALTLLYASQCVAAAAFWWGWEVYGQALAWRDYRTLNNVLWLAQLVAVASPGGISVAGGVVNTLRRRADRRHRGGIPA